MMTSVIIEIGNVVVDVGVVEGGVVVEGQDQEVLQGEIGIVDQVGIGIVDQIEHQQQEREEEKEIIMIVGNQEKEAVEMKEEVGVIQGVKKVLEVAVQVIEGGREMVVAVEGEVGVTVEVLVQVVMIVGTNDDLQGHILNRQEGRNVMWMKLKKDLL